MIIVYRNTTIDISDKSLYAAVSDNLHSAGDVMSVSIQFPNGTKERFSEIITNPSDIAQSLSQIKSTIDTWHDTQSKLQDILTRVFGKDSFSYVKDQ